MVAYFGSQVSAELIACCLLILYVLFIRDKEV